MATRNIVPNADEEGWLGRVTKKWLKLWIKDIHLTGSITNGVDSISAGDLVAGNVYGQNYQYAESEGTSFTTSTTYQTKVQLVTPALPAGKYEISYSCEAGQNNTNDRVQVLVEDDSGNIIGNPQKETADTVDEIPFAGFRELTYGAGVKTITLSFREQAGGTARVSRARLSIKRVA